MVLLCNNQYFCKAGFYQNIPRDPYKMSKWESKDALFLKGRNSSFCEIECV